MKYKRRYSYRFLFIPGTIGSIAWLSQHEPETSRVKHGLVLASVGAGDKFTYKKSRRGDTEIDRAALSVLRHSGSSYDILDFSPYGYDERQFCSPGFNLPVGCLMRTPNGCFSQYHTSADNLSFVQPTVLAESFELAFAILSLLENNGTYLNQNPKCEPRLGKAWALSHLGWGRRRFRRACSSLGSESFRRHTQSTRHSGAFGMRLQHHQASSRPVGRTASALRKRIEVSHTLLCLPSTVLCSP